MDVLPATWLVKRIKRLLNKSSTSCTLYSIWCNNRTIMNTCKAGQRKFTDRIDRWSVQVYCLDVLTNAYSLWVILTLSIINRVCNESPPATSPDKRWKLFVFYFSRTWFMSWKEAWWVAHVFQHVAWHHLHQSLKLGHWMNTISALFYDRSYKTTTTTNYFVC